jgi:hypothetical protein
MTKSQFAEATPVSRAWVYKLEDGQACGGVVWNKIHKAWRPELAECRLTWEDFFAGRVLSAPVRKRGG